MSSLLPSRLLRSAEQSALPAGLAGVLLAALLIEALLPATTPLPPVMLPPLRAGTGSVGSEALTAMPVPPRPAILATPIFAPRGGKGPGTGGGASGFSLAGTALSRGTALAIVRTSAGTQLLRPGQSIDGYRLVAVARNGAMFAGKDGRHALRVGASVGAAPTAAPAASEESDQ